ncbi:MAG TPA: selenium cofactor biosynthesis protein YqeC [Clostridia bacterium]|nr:selenium cofactor biosynthesis protein YqeC [Clostridia bacterium]
MKRRAFFSRTTVSRTLGILPGVTAIVGSGGKTTLMLRLARELSRGASVVVATSTRIRPPEGVPLVIGGTEEVAAALASHPLVCAGAYAESGKLSAPAVPFRELALLADYVLVEADGARNLPLKAHASHEPVIPGGARVLFVVGASGFGKAICEAAHRPELYAAQLGCGMDAIVTPELAAKAARLFLPGCTAIVNQVDDSKTLALAEEFAHAYGAGTVIAAALQQKRAVRAVWRE